MTYQVKKRFQNVPFKRNLQRYIGGASVRYALRAKIVAFGAWRREGVRRAVGLYKLNPPVITHSLRAPGFINPWTLHVISWFHAFAFGFKPLLFRIRLVPLQRGAAAAAGGAAAQRRRGGGRARVASLARARRSGAVHVQCSGHVARKRVVTHPNE
jgi:hypothetical protein